MFNLDLTCLYVLNGFIGRSPIFDKTLHFLSDFHAIKMTPLVLILWGLWFQTASNNFDARKSLVKAFVASFLAMAIARALSLSLPFRLRPLHNSELNLNLASDVSRNTLDNWSSFPSDHAVLGFALATSIFLINRRWGIFAIAHTLLIICLPRMYLSLHYPSDIFGGAVIGVVTAWIVMRTDISAPITNRIYYLEKSQPVIFYIFFLIVASQLMTMFRDARMLVSMAFHLLKG